MMICLFGKNCLYQIIIIIEIFIVRNNMFKIKTIKIIINKNGINNISENS